MSEYKVEVLPGTGTSPEVVLVQVAEKIKPTDTVFIVVVDENDDVWVRSSRFKSHKLINAAGHLNAYAVNQVRINTEPL